ncbi:MAG: sugar phosphate isomerase/epimerase [Lentisphaeria bacterium]|nr:sugar phosphate isomerase/epimerase [Lentisphaeria bacterium]
MRYGAHIFLWVRHWADEHVSLLARARELGLDWIEIALGEDVVFSSRLTRRCAEESGLELVFSPGDGWPVGMDISLAAPDARRRAVAWHRRQIAVAAECGGTAYTGALYGQPGTVERRLPTRDDLLRVAEGLHQLAETAAASGLRLAIEPMSHFRTHVVTNPAQAAELVRLTDHPAVGVLFDTYHMVTEVRDYGAALRGLGSALWGLHACESDRGVPGGGLVPWRPIATALRELRFSGHIGLESYHSGPAGMAVSRGLFTDCCPDGDRFVREGLAFLRGLLAGEETG